MACPATVCKSSNCIPVSEPRAARPTASTAPAPKRGSAFSEKTKLKGRRQEALEALESGYTFHHAPRGTWEGAANSSAYWDLRWKLGQAGYVGHMDVVVYL